jgi:hypothetical protein
MFATDTEPHSNHTIKAAIPELERVQIEYAKRPLGPRVLVAAEKSDGSRFEARSWIIASVSLGSRQMVSIVVLSLTTTDYLSVAHTASLCQIKYQAPILSFCSKESASYRTCTAIT